MIAATAGVERPRWRAGRITCGQSQGQHQTGAKSADERQDRRDHHEAAQDEADRADDDEGRLRTRTDLAEGSDAQDKPGRAESHDDDSGNGQAAMNGVVAGATGEDGDDVKAGDALGREQSGDHGRDDRTNKHPDHAGPGDLEGPCGEVGVASLPPGKPGKSQDQAGDHGNGRRRDAQNHSLSQHVSPQLARLRAVSGGKGQRAALSGRTDGKGRTCKQGGLDEDADRGEEYEKVLAPVRADHLRDLRIQLGLWWRVQEDLAALDQQSVVV
jgi:hypothetical protein